MEVKVNANNIDRALKLLKREVEKEGLFRDLKNKRFYEKPSVKKRRKQREARKRKIKASRYRRAQQKRS
ncbi:MAG: 30S ribosomal protein S21 [Nitrospirae bacterium]|nr:MAG: 30S ribosomal protein S21 [Nitrospirota bacterium]